MNAIDTIYLTGDLIAEKCCGCKEAWPIIIQQTKEPCCFDNAEMLAWIICGAVVAVTLLVVVGWLIRHKMDYCSKVLEAENKRKEQERDSLIKLKQEYQAKVLDELQAEQADSTLIKKREGYIKELEERIAELNKELGIKKELCTKKVEENKDHQ